MADNTRMTIQQMNEFLQGTSKGATGNEVAKASVDDDGKVTIYESTIQKLGAEMTDEVFKNFKPVMTDVLTKLTAEEYTALGTKLDEQLARTHEDLLALAESARPIVVKTETKETKLKGVNHNQLPNLLKIVGAGQAVLLVGPAGTGKSHAAETVANSLDIPFHAISVGSQTSKSDLLGYMTAVGGYVGTQFRAAYEHGGLFLLDEADAGNSNVLILLNAALSNGQMAFPDKMVKVHPAFRIVATANTYGNGASRQYVGRNQLDAATLDRFAVLDWNIDDKVEEVLAGNTKDGKRWLAVVRAVRKRVTDELELRVVISPRATQRGAKLLAAGLTFEDVLHSSLTGSIPAHQRAEINNLAQSIWVK